MITDLLLSVGIVLLFYEVGWRKTWKPGLIDAGLISQKFTKAKPLLSKKPS